MKATDVESAAGFITHFHAKEISMKRIIAAFAFIVVLAVTVTAQTSSFSKGMYCLACCHQKCGDTCCKDGCRDSCCQSK